MTPRPALIASRRWQKRTQTPENLESVMNVSGAAAVVEDITVSPRPC